jgi:RNA polymerase sigma-70 factor (ECF subfamily)
MFRLFVLDGFPAAAVAAKLGTTPNAVFIAKSRVMARLRQEAEGLIEY